MSFPFRILLAVFAAANAATGKASPFLRLAVRLLFPVLPFLSGVQAGRLVGDTPLHGTAIDVPLVGGDVLQVAETPVVDGRTRLAPVLTVETLDHAERLDETIELKAGREEVVSLPFRVTQGVRVVVRPCPPAEVAVGEAHKAIRRFGRVVPVVARLVLLHVVEAVTPPEGGVPFRLRACVTLAVGVVEVLRAALLARRQADACRLSRSTTQVIPVVTRQGEKEAIPTGLPRKVVPEVARVKETEGTSVHEVLPVLVATPLEGRLGARP